MKVKSNYIPLAFCLLLFLLGTVHVAHAQFNACQDTLNTTPVYCPPPNDTLYQPVCGCNNVTYNNICYFNQAHLLQYTQGPCEEVVIPRIYPSPAESVITYRIVTKQQDNVNVYVYDTYGQVRNYVYIAGMMDVTQQLDVSSMQTGVYLLVAIANGHFAYKKFVKF